jgi:hypothetical protein
MFFWIVSFIMLKVTLIYYQWLWQFINSYCSTINWYDDQLIWVLLTNAFQVQFFELHPKMHAAVLVRVGGKVRVPRVFLQSLFDLMIRINWSLEYILLKLRSLKPLSMKFYTDYLLVFFSFFHLPGNSIQVSNLFMFSFSIVAQCLPFFFSNYYLCSLSFTFHEYAIFTCFQM